MAEQEASLGDFLFELLPGVHLTDVVIPEFEGSGVNVVLNVHEQVFNALCKSFHRCGYLFEGVTAGNLHCPVCKVTGSHCKAYRNALELPFCKLETRAEGVAVINLDAVAVSLKFCLELVHLFENGFVILFVLADNRDYNYLDRSEFRRQNQSVVISVSHNQRTHQTC